ncbi:hypothetical protein [Haliea sp. E17]|uniref:hypothetical protein n=1 Tax=Haliea sp. E17 TaxID=3401576 RepID=UPI003AB08D35
MLTERLFFFGRAILPILYLLSLSSCASMGSSPPESEAGNEVLGNSADSQADEGPTPNTEVRGNYENGFWFDRGLFFVWVIANSPEEAERVARLTATDACSRRNEPLKVIFTENWQERRLFIPIKIDRFSCEIRFRCVDGGNVP